MLPQVFALSCWTNLSHGWGGLDGMSFANFEEAVVRLGFTEGHSNRRLLDRSSRLPCVSICILHQSQHIYFKRAGTKVCCSRFISSKLVSRGGSKAPTNDRERLMFEAALYDRSSGPMGRFDDSINTQFSLAYTQDAVLPPSSLERNWSLAEHEQFTLMERLGADTAVKRALDAMVRLLDQQHAGSVPEAVRKVLDRLDRNGDGRLSYAEVQSGLLDLGLRPVSSDVEAVMRALDSDGSGYVDYRELYTALTKHTLAPSALEDAAPRALLRSAARCTAAELLCQHRCMPWFGACVSRHGMCVCFDTGPATHGSMWTRTAGLRSAMRSRSMTR